MDSLICYSRFDGLHLLKSPFKSQLNTLDMDICNSLLEISLILSPTHLHVRPKLLGNLGIYHANIVAGGKYEAKFDIHIALVQMIHYRSLFACT